jgi:hypothetical protein
MPGAEFDIAFINIHLSGVDANWALFVDAKLNAAKSIVAERLDNALAMIVDCAKTKHWTVLMPKLVDDAEVALAAWRKLSRP